MAICPKNEAISMQLFIILVHNHHVKRKRDGGGDWVIEFNMRLINNEKKVILIHLWTAWSIPQIGINN